MRRRERKQFIVNFISSVVCVRVGFYYYFRRIRAHRKHYLHYKAVFITQMKKIPSKRKLRNKTKCTHCPLDWSWCRCAVRFLCIHKFDSIPRTHAPIHTHTDTSIETQPQKKFYLVESIGGLSLCCIY